jgi:hypothetical protein
MKFAELQASRAVLNAPMTADSNASLPLIVIGPRMSGSSWNFDGDPRG